MEYFSEKEAAQDVLDILTSAKFEARIVGGCVRDQLLYRKPKDYDVVTNATPEEITGLFEKTIAVGAKFGVIIAVVNGFHIEVATYRSDGVYTDGRRPDEVQYAETLEEDVFRRDFTINGLACAEASIAGSISVIDYVGGKEDLKRRIIRTIGSARERFNEDPLRMLRAIRLAAQLGFQIDKLTFRAIQDKAHLITKVSRERVRDELVKLLQSDEPGEGMLLLMRSGLVSTAIPMFWNVNVKGLLRVLEHVKMKSNRSSGFMLGCLMETLPTFARIEMIESLKLSNDETEMIHSMFDWPMLQMFRSDFDTSRHTLKRAMRDPYFKERVALGEAYASTESRPDILKQFDGILQHIAALQSEGLYPDKLLNGFELESMGFKGPEIKDALRRLEDKQLDGKISTKEGATGFLHAILEIKKVST
jgi:poly(A) polymerase